MFLPFWTIGGLISKATEGYPLDDMLQYLQAKVSHYRCLRFLRQLQAARDTERARLLELLTKLKWERKTRDGGFIIFTILHCMHACMLQIQALGVVVFEGSFGELFLCCNHIALCRHLWSY